MQPRPQSILILTGSFGHGHNTAANNLEAAFQDALEPDTTIAVVDFFQEAYPWSNGLLRKGYGLAINQFPRLWHFIYGQADREGGPSLVPLKTFGSKLKKWFEKQQPTVVVSTFPIFPLLIGQCYPDPDTRPFAAVHDDHRRHQHQCDLVSGAQRSSLCHRRLVERDRHERRHPRGTDSRSRFPPYRLQPKRRRWKNYQQQTLSFSTFPPRPRAM